MVTLILTRIVFVLSIPLCLYAVYFGVVALFGLRKKLPAAPQAKPEKRFALVVAARNEAAVIGHLVDSLYGQDNCTDDTEAVAAGRGARIFRPEGVIRSKGEVLTQVVDKIVLAEEFDAMCVFDADNLVDGQFLARMNDALVSGAQVAQGFRDSKNPEQSAISGCYSICYWMLNRFYNGARSALHLSALVNGSGFAVTTALLRRLGGWHTVTMTEDYEFSAQCAMLGERVHFVPEALIYDEQPLTFRQSWKQRRRWTTGSLQGLQNYGHGLFSSFVLHGSLICLDMYLTFLVPMVQLASVVLGIAVLVLTLMRPGRGRLERALLKKTFWDVASNPILIGILVGILWSLLRIPQPVIFQKTLSNFAGVATPMGLIGLGASVDAARAREELPPAMVCCFFKLIAFVALFLPVAVLLGYRTDKLVTVLIMLGSATTSSSFVMARNLGYEGALTANTVMLTTCLSAFALTGWLYLLRSLGMV